MENLRISGIQSDLIWEDREKNLAHFQKKISSLSGKSDLVILPEMSASVGA